jgi:hypothetical protein
MSSTYWRIYCNTEGGVWVTTTAQSTTAPTTCPNNSLHVVNVDSPQIIPPDITIINANVVSAGVSSTNLDIKVSSLGVSSLATNVAVALLGVSTGVSFTTLDNKIISSGGVSIANLDNDIILLGVSVGISFNNVSSKIDQLGVSSLATNVAVALLGVSNTNQDIRIGVLGISTSIIDAKVAAVTAGTASVIKTAVITEQFATATNGGTFSNGAWRIRAINTIDTDPSGIVLSLTTNQFTIGPGSYYISGSAPAFRVGTHKTQLFNVTGNVVQQIGTAENSPNTTSACTSRSFFDEYVVVTANTTFRVEHQCQTTRATDGLGVASGFSVVEVYTRVTIQKLA